MKIKWLLVVMLGMIATTRQARGSHAMGADLTYKCLGGDSVEITLKFYRDCSGIAPNTSMLVEYHSNSCNVINKTLTVTLATPSKEVTPICKTAVSTCSGGIYPGAQEYIYKGIVVLPKKCNDWVFSFTECCRNSGITGVVNPGNEQLYVEASYNNTLSQCNSSAVFSNHPVPWVCKGQTFCFTHGAVDADGDSLVYRLVPPENTINDSLNYVAGYSSVNPLSSNPPLAIDPLTGQICMTPTKTEVTVMAVRVDEYRNGVKIGSVRRDMQITVINCVNDLPSASGIDGSTSFSITTCADVPLCFNIYSSDQDASQNVIMKWNNGIPGGTFTTSSGSRPTGTFCWTPTVADVSTIPYLFTVTVNDSACPYNGIQTFTYAITVQTNCVQLDVKAVPNTICKGFCTNLTATASGGYPPYKYLWDDGSTSSTRAVCPTVTTIYNCTVTDKYGLKAIDTTQVTINNLPTIGMTTSAGICKGSSTTLTASGGSNYVWTPGGATTSSISVTPNTNTTYNVKVTTVNGCIDSAKTTITVNNNPTLTISPQATICKGANATLTVGGALNYVWTPAGTGGVTTGNSLGVSPASNTTYSVVGTDANGCTGNASVSVNVNQLPVAGISSPFSICAGETATLTASGGSSYLWSNNSTTSSITVTPGTTSNYSVVVSDANNCTNSASTTITVNSLPTLTISNPLSVCKGVSATLTVGGSSATYSWSSGGNGSSINVTPSKTTTYSVVATNSFNCTSTSSTSITVNNLPVATITTPLGICLNSSTTLTAGGGTSYVWSPGGATTSSITVSPASTTAYSCTVTDANNCSSVASTNVTVNANLLVTIAPVTICNGQSATVIANVGNAISYSWSTGAVTSSIIVQPTSTTSYNVVATDINGCTGSAIGNVTVNALPNITASPVKAAICIGDSTVLNGSGGISYSWSPLSITGNGISVLPSAAGTYNYNVIGTDANGCTNTATTSLKVNPLPVISVTPPQAVCTGFSATITATGAQSYVWSPGNLTGSSITVTPPGSSNYSVVGTDANGCFNNASTNVVVNPNLSVSINPATICFGDSTVLTAVSLGATNYSWSTGAITPSITVAPGTTSSYNVNVSDVNGCTGSGSGTVTVNQLPTITTTPVKPSFCIGDQTRLNASGGVSYSWSTKEITSAINIQPSSAGTFSYSVIGTDANGCKNIASTSVTVNPLPVVSITPPQAVCTGFSATITASGALTYVWSPGNSTGSSITVTPPSNSNYSVVGTDANGCINNASTNVVVNPNLSVSISPAAICFGDSTVLTAVSLGATNYSWSTGDITPSITVAPVTTSSYNVNVSDVNGCTGSGSATVTVNQLPTITATPVKPSFCIGDQTQLNASGGVFYSWSTKEITSAINVQPSSAGSFPYSVIGTDANGCKNNASTSVTVNPLPVVTISGPQNACAGNNVTITAAGGTTYSWSTGDTGPTLNLNPTSTSNYSVTVTDANGCVNNAGTSVTVYQFLVVTVAPDTICDGKTTTLRAESPNATMFSWSTGESTQSIQVTPNTTSTYNVTVNNSTGCSGTTSVDVTVNPLPQINITPLTPICIGDQTTLTVSGGINYSWISSDGNSFVGNTIVVDPTSTTVYDVTVTDLNGCVNIASTSVEVNPLPTVTISNDFHYCNGSSVQLTAGGGVSYIWTPGGATGSNPTVSPSGNSTYAVLVTDINGCTNTASVNLFVDYSPTADAGQNIDICEGESAQVEAKNITSGWIYNWSPTLDLINDKGYKAVFAGRTTTTLKLIVRDPASTCTPVEDSILINVHPTPVIDAGLDTSIIVGDIVELHAASLTTIQWLPATGISCFGCVDQSVQPLKTTSYVVTTVDQYGCRNQDTVTINVEDIITLYVPNAFTPDGHKNFEFKAFGIGVHDFEFYIFNRWGQIVFKTNDISEGWNGTYQGQQVQNDVYVYLAKAISITGKSISRTGPITIVR